MNEVTNSLIRFLNIILCAILAGVSFGIWIGFNPMHLSPATYVEQQQNMLNSLRTLMIALVVIATFVTLLNSYLHRANGRVCGILITAAAFLIACILITRFGIKPIDDAVMGWSSAAVPPDWTAFRDKWWSLHILRTVAELVALCLVTWTGITSSKALN